MYKIKDIQNLRVIIEQWGKESLSLISFFNVQLRKFIRFQNKNILQHQNSSTFYCISSILYYSRFFHG